MEKFPEPTISDQDLELFIIWLEDKENIGKKAIALIVDALKKLRADRTLLTQKLMDKDDV